MCCVETAPMPSGLWSCARVSILCAYKHPCCNMCSACSPPRELYTPRRRQPLSHATAQRSGLGAAHESRHVSVKQSLVSLHRGERDLPSLKRHDRRHPTARRRACRRCASATANAAAAAATADAGAAAAWATHPRPRLSSEVSPAAVGPLLSRTLSMRPYWSASSASR